MSSMKTKSHSERVDKVAQHFSVKSLTQSVKSGAKMESQLNYCFDLFWPLQHNGSVELPSLPPELKVDGNVTSRHAFRELFFIDLALGSGVCVSVCLSVCRSACLRFGVLVRLHVSVCAPAVSTRLCVCTRRQSVLHRLVSSPCVGGENT